MNNITTRNTYRPSFASRLSSATSALNYLLTPSKYLLSDDKVDANEVENDAEEVLATKALHTAAIQALNKEANGGSKLVLNQYSMAQYTVFRAKYLKYKANNGQALLTSFMEAHALYGFADSLRVLDIVAEEKTIGTEQLMAKIDEHFGIFINTDSCQEKLLKIAMKPTLVFNLEECQIYSGNFSLLLRENPRLFEHKSEIELSIDLFNGFQPLDLKERLLKYPLELRSSASTLKIPLLASIAVTCC
jgi:hypothetical protein